jgi:hypothetical protein
MSGAKWLPSALGALSNRTPGGGTRFVSQPGAATKRVASRQALGQSERLHVALRVRQVEKRQWIKEPTPWAAPINDKPRSNRLGRCQPI